MSNGGTFKITTAAPIVVEIDDVRVEFFADPPEEPLLDMMRAQQSFGPTPEEQLQGVSALRGCLRGLVLPASRDAWEQLTEAGTISLGVTMQLFEHITSVYSESLGFRGGSPARSTAGRPANGPTSEASSAAPVPATSPA